MDFLVERNGNVLPLEVKSGRNFKSHAALDNLMSEREFAIPCAWVLSGNGEVSRDGSIVYMPVYFMMFLKRDAFDKPLIYKVE